MNQCSDNHLVTYISALILIQLHKSVQQEPHNNTNQWIENHPMTKTVHGEPPSNMNQCIENHPVTLNIALRTIQ